MESFRLTFQVLAIVYSANRISGSCSVAHNTTRVALCAYIVS